MVFIAQYALKEIYMYKIFIAFINGGNCPYENVSDYDIRETYLKLFFEDGSQKIFPLHNLESIYIEDAPDP